MVVLRRKLSYKALRVTSVIKVHRSQICNGIVSAYRLMSILRHDGKVFNKTAVESRKTYIRYS